eukprot:6564073-Pyramimonas_sp.AAC.1
MPPLSPDAEINGVAPEEASLQALAQCQTACKRSRASAPSLGGISGRMLAEFGAGMGRIYVP